MAHASGRLMPTMFDGFVNSLAFASTAGRGLDFYPSGRFALRLSAILHRFLKWVKKAQLHSQCYPYLKSTDFSTNTMVPGTPVSGLALQADEGSKNCVSG
jgi:hypothetical protein